MSTSKPRIILASQSPRRKQLLSEAGFEFEVLKLNVDEEFPNDLPAPEVAPWLALHKASQSPAMPPDVMLITADTTVCVQNKVLNKPAHEQEAFEMLSLLSGAAHQVVTGVCIKYKNQFHTFSQATTVCFRKLHQDEINYYIEHYKPFDKAGAYGIQEWIGLIGIEKIEGCFYNVMGFPVAKFYQTYQALIKPVNNP